MQIIASLAGSAPFQKFEAALSALIPEWAARTNGPPLLLAVSGGPDSLALLALAAACYPGRVAAMTVDHGLRDEAADEANYVGQICADNNIPHRIATPPHPIAGNNIQAVAREARYALLEEESERHGGSFILTAHHHDDQVETLLMRLSRGSGIAGLSGIRPRNGRIIRPLLGFTKADLHEICKQAGWSAVLDPSNLDMAYDRVRMRHILEQVSLPIGPNALARSTKAIREADEALHWMTKRLAASQLDISGSTATLSYKDMPHELLRRLFLHALSHFGEVRPRGEQIERAIQSLFNGTPVTFNLVMVRPDRKGDPKWHFTPAPPRTVRE